LQVSLLSYYPHTLIDLWMEAGVDDVSLVVLQLSWTLLAALGSLRRCRAVSSSGQLF